MHRGQALIVAGVFRSLGYLSSNPRAASGNCRGQNIQRTRIRSTSLFPSPTRRAKDGTDARPGVAARTAAITTLNGHMNSTSREIASLKSRLHQMMRERKLLGLHAVPVPGTAVVSTGVERDLQSFLRNGAGNGTAGAGKRVVRGGPLNLSRTTEVKSSVNNFLNHEIEVQLTATCKTLKFKTCFKRGSPPCRFTDASPKFVPTTFQFCEGPTERDVNPSHGTRRTGATGTACSPKRNEFRPRAADLGACATREMALRKAAEQALRSIERKKYEEREARLRAGEEDLDRERAEWGAKLKAFGESLEESGRKRSAPQAELEQKDEDEGGTLYFGNVFSLTKSFQLSVQRTSPQSPPISTTIPRKCSKFNRLVAHRNLVVGTVD
ncbi:hypothetical protein B0H16DRAFT_1799585 [Mycena metata]|uniref:Uncharacterized protein n=1 Tax=Mycena metata TaxID=1033252 RepID=A0AAD7NJY1_9AGAR|nr:hypothetical protein B0H16DRAFT_1799585 [Mycena metata]